MREKIIRASKPTVEIESNRELKFFAWQSIAFNEGLAL